MNESNTAETDEEKLVAILLYSYYAQGVTE